MSMVSEARNFAVAAHAGQTYGRYPYVKHLDDVVGILKDHGHGRSTLVIGYLHDILEDTDVNFNLMAALFGYEVACAVALISDPEEGNRTERKRVLKRKVSLVKAKGPLPQWAVKGMIVKVADRLANVRNCKNNKRSMLDKYYEEQPSFKETFYIEGVAEDMWEALEDELER